MILCVGTHFFIDYLIVFLVFLRFLSLSPPSSRLHLYTVLMGILALALPVTIIGSNFAKIHSEMRQEMLEKDQRGLIDMWRETAALHELLESPQQTPPVEIKEEESVSVKDTSDARININKYVTSSPVEKDTKKKEVAGTKQTLSQNDITQKLNLCSEQLHNALKTIEILQKQMKHQQQEVYR